MTSAKEVPILNVWQLYIGTEIKPKGHSHWAACPFHADKTPSLNISSGLNRWHCFSCGEGGSGVDLVMRAKGLGFREACCQIEKDFSISRDGPIQLITVRKKSPEQILEFQYFGLIDLLLLDKKAIKLQLRVFSDPDQIPGILVHQLGKIEVTLDELLMGNIEEKAAALVRGLKGNGQYRRDVS